MSFHTPGSKKGGTTVKAKGKAAAGKKMPAELKERFAAKSAKSKTRTNKNGATITKNKDGSKTVTKTNKSGKTVTKVKKADGSKTVTRTNAKTGASTKTKITSGGSVKRVDKTSAKGRTKSYGKNTSKVGDVNHRRAIRKGKRTYAKNNPK